MLRIRATRQLRDFMLDVDIAVADGETLVLMGSNGSGKTTVLNLISGLMRPDEGTIETAGMTLFSEEAGIDVPPEARNIGYVFQNYALFPHMTVFDNVAFGLRMRRTTPREIRRQVEEELGPVGLWELRNVKASRLSGGQKQKVALARCLITEPALLLLDEPLNALDAETHDLLRESIHQRLKRERITSIIVLHSASDTLTLGGRVCVMDRGKVVLSGLPAEILEHGRTGDNLFN
ncbi:MAG TPA: ABC transporter ATP-binding protein [Methanocella sp.]|nr:ABC transporter ATP-binding protein [Methanocella sp.]